jgi:hypothetical protein
MYRTIWSPLKVLIRNNIENLLVTMINNYFYFSQNCPTEPERSMKEYNEQVHPSFDMDVKLIADSRLFLLEIIILIAVRRKLSKTTPYLRTALNIRSRISVCRIEDHHIFIFAWMLKYFYITDEQFVLWSNFLLKTNVRGSIVVSIPACHAGNRGSIPRRGVAFFLIFHPHNIMLLSWLVNKNKRTWANLSMTKRNTLKVIDIIHFLFSAVMCRWILLVK